MKESGNKEEFGVMSLERSGKRIRPHRTTSWGRTPSFIAVPTNHPVASSRARALELIARCPPPPRPAKKGASPPPAANAAETSGCNQQRRPYARSGGGRPTWCGGLGEAPNEVLLSDSPGLTTDFGDASALAKKLASLGYSNFSFETRTQVMRVRVSNTDQLYDEAERRVVPHCPL